jgi:hypothetical protein
MFFAFFLISRLHNALALQFGLAVLVCIKIWLQNAGIKKCLRLIQSYLRTLICKEFCFQQCLKFEFDCSLK